MYGNGGDDDDVLRKRRRAVCPTMHCRSIVWPSSGMCYVCIHAYTSINLHAYDVCNFACMCMYFCMYECIHKCLHVYTYIPHTYTSHEYIPSTCIPHTYIQKARQEICHAANELTHMYIIIMIIMIMINNYTFSKHPTPIHTPNSNYTYRAPNKCTRTE